MISIYISGPITGGNQEENVYKGIAVAYKFMDAGIVPFVPHLSWFMDQHRPRDYEDWMWQDCYWVGQCTAFFRMPGKSPGADREQAYAEEIGKLIFYDFNRAVSCLQP